MMADFGTEQLQDMIRFSQIDTQDPLNTENKKMTSFHQYLRECAEGIYSRLSKMKRNENDLTLEQYMDEFYQKIMIEKRCTTQEALKIKLNKKEADYFIIFDETWKDIFNELVQETKGFKKNIPKEKKLTVSVVFKSIEAKKIFNKICILLLLKSKSINLNDNPEQQELSETEKRKKEMILKIIFANFVIFRSTNTQKEFFKQPYRIDLKAFTPEVANPEDKHLVTYKNPYVLLPHNLSINLISEKIDPVDLVKFMKYVVSNQDFEYISYEEIDQFEIQSEKEDENEFKKLEYFINYFYFYKEADGKEQQSRYAFVPEQVLNNGVQSMKETCFGLEGFLENNQMKSLLEEFKNPLRFYECKGPLIYGPPGTGKTFIIQKMIDNFKIHLIFDGNSSTFQTSLQGQGSRLLTIYFNCARAIPWQPCAAHIGEIEQLVKKKDSDGGGGSSEVLNKLLELTDGTETVGNVKIFSTTNHVEMIEEAILSRFRQVYLGKSNTPLRRDWIVWYLLQINKEHSEEYFKKIMSAFFPNLKEFLQSPKKEQENQLRVAIKDIVNYTINFSTRQLKALMSNITSKITFGILTLKSTPEEKLKCILDFCKSLGEDNFMFGNRSLPQLMFDSMSHPYMPSEQLKSNFLTITGRNQNQRADLSQSQVEAFQQQMGMLEQEDELNNIFTQQLIQEKYQQSKVIFIDQSAVANERINILLQKSRISERISLYQKAENIYTKLEVIVESILKCNSFEKSKKSIESLQTQFNKFLQQNEEFYKVYTQQKRIFPQETLKSLEKYHEALKKRQEPNNHTLEQIVNYVNNLRNEMKVVDKLINDVRKDLETYLNHSNFKLLVEKLKDINNILQRENNQIDSLSLLREYKKVMSEYSKSLSSQLRKIISPEQLEEKTVEELVKQKKFYQLNLCSLYDSSYDHIMVLLAEFIKNGDFSKVDMVDYHSCERNNAFKDINSFKDYISGLTKEGKEEEKSLIVYKLDEILDVTSAEDAEIEKDKQQMAIKIFQTINIDTFNSNLWSVFIAKNSNVIDLFYNTVTYWPKTSKKGKQNQIQQEQLQLVECSLCHNQFKECDDEDKCKAHHDNSFFIESNTERYKKFEGDWYSTYLEEYYKKKKHVDSHKNDFPNKSQNSTKFVQKGCTYCDNEQRVEGSFQQKIYHLNEVSFNLMKQYSIIPPYFDSYQDLISFKKSVPLYEIKQRIEDGSLYPGEVKRVCCQGDYYKEECNPHKHLKQKELKEDNIKKEVNEFIQNLIKEVKK